MFSCLLGMVGYAIARLNFYSVDLSVKKEGVIFLRFILTFRLAIDAELHQKNRIQGGKPIRVRAAKITLITNNF